MGDFFGDHRTQNPGRIFATAGSQRIHQAGFMPIIWPDKLSPRSDFNPTELNRLIWQFGLPALWELWAPCPCGHSQAGSTDCPQCFGLGRVYHTQQEILVATTGVRRDWAPFMQQNMMERGTALFCMRGEHVPCSGDRISMTTAHIPISGAAYRRAERADPTVQHPSAVERLRYPVLPQDIVVEDADNNPVVQSYGVIYLQGQAPDGLPGPILVEGSDFDVTEDGWFDWAKGDIKPTPTTPAPGAMYSFYYRTRPVYRVDDFPAAFRDTITQIKSEDTRVEVLPVECIGRLEWLLEATA